MHGSVDEAGGAAISSASFASAISTVVVAQICHSLGCHGARASVLRALSDIATRYIQTLARFAAETANSRGRTDSNVLDLVRTIEDLCSGRGFSGASDPTRPLLRSAVLKEIIAFVRSVDETPFARPIRRRAASSAGTPESFLQAGKEPPMPHVPPWLPCFPESSRESHDKGKRCRESASKEFDSSADRRLPIERTRVRFSIRAHRGRRNKKAFRAADVGARNGKGTSDRET